MLSFGGSGGAARAGGSGSSSGTGACGCGAGVGSDLRLGGCREGELLPMQPAGGRWAPRGGVTAPSHLPTARERGQERGNPQEFTPQLYNLLDSHPKNQKRRIWEGGAFWEAVSDVLLCACSLDCLSPVEDAELQPDPGFASVLLIPSQRRCQIPSVSRRRGPHASFCEGTAWGCSGKKKKKGIKKPQTHAARPSVD